MRWVNMVAVVNSEDSVIDVANKLGLEGWEPWGHQNTGWHRAVVFFKRPIPDPTDPRAHTSKKET